MISDDNKPSHNDKPEHNKPSHNDKPEHNKPSHNDKPEHNKPGHREEQVSKDATLKQMQDEVLKVKEALEHLKQQKTKTHDTIFREVEPKLSYIKHTGADDEFARLDELFANNMRVEPFGNNAFPVDWINISLAELISIPQVNCDWATQSKISQAYHKYGHLIIGKEQESRKYYIGIPDTAMRSRRNSIDIDRVIEFVQKQGRKARGVENGYWIAHL